MTDSLKIGELFASLEDDAMTLSDADELARQMADQNSRYNEALRILGDDPEILELVKFGIAEEQEETFSYIQSLAPESSRVYENLGNTSLAIENGMSSVGNQISELERSIVDQEALLAEQNELKQEQAQTETEKIIEKVERLAPRAVESVKEMLESRGINPIKDSEIIDLEDRVLDLMDQEDEARRELERIRASSGALDAVVGKIAVDWALPFALIDQGYSFFAILDELPVEPVLADCPTREVKQFAERHIDQPKAALYTALCLSEHSGQTVTVDQIAQALYSPEVIAKISEYHLRARVTTTLGPKVGGENLRAILDKEGYILQYGWRRTLEQREDGHIAVVKRQRIYRAISKDQVEDFVDLTSFEGEGFRDSFEALRIPQSVAAVAPESTSDTTELDEVATDTDPTSGPTSGSSDHTEPDNPGEVVMPRDDISETNSQRRERLKNELCAAISGQAHLIIKTLAEHGALEEDGIRLGRLKGIYAATEITDDDVRHCVSSSVATDHDYWLKNIDAVRLLLSVTHEDETVRTSVSSGRWRIVVNEKIEELIQRELRGIERRRELTSQ